MDVIDVSSVVNLYTCAPFPLKIQIKNILWSLQLSLLDSFFKYLHTKYTQKSTLHIVPFAAILSIYNIL